MDSFSPETERQRKNGVNCIPSKSIHEIARWTRLSFCAGNVPIDTIAERNQKEQESTHKREELRRTRQHKRRNESKHNANHTDSISAHP